MGAVIYSLVSVFGGGVEDGRLTSNRHSSIIQVAYRCFGHIIDCLDLPAQHREIVGQDLHLFGSVCGSSREGEGRRRESNGAQRRRYPDFGVHDGDRGEGVLRCIRRTWQRSIEVKKINNEQKQK